MVGSEFGVKNMKAWIHPAITVYVYTASNLHISVLLLGQHEKGIVIMGVINGQIFIIANIS